MEKLSLTILLTVLIWTNTNESYGQMSRGQIKRNNKHIAAYRGRNLAKMRYSGIGVSLSALNYYGDLSPLPSKFSTDISFTRPAFGLGFFRKLGPRYSVLGQLTFGTLEGSDSRSSKSDDLGNGVFRYKRNLSFRNHIEELSVVGVFDLFENFGSYLSRPKWTPYAFIGLAVFHHNPQAQAPQKFLDGSPNPYAGQWVDLEPLGTEGQYTPGSHVKPYSLFQFAVPFGIGGRFRLGEAFDLWADVGFRYTWTDHLDDVSGDYIDLDKIQSKGNNPTTNKLAAAMSYRTNEVIGNPDSTISGAHFYPSTSNSGDFYTWPGYGSSGKDNWRGHSNHGDIYMVTSVKVTYVVGAKIGSSKAKFR